MCDGCALAGGGGELRDTSTGRPTITGGTPLGPPDTHKENTMTNTTVVTDEMIAEAILVALTELTDTDGELVAWAKLRKRLPGNPSRHGAVLLQMWQDHRLDIMKIDGLNYVIANDALDDKIAAIELARYPRRPRVQMTLYS